MADGMKKADLIALSKSEGVKVDVNSREVLDDPASRVRLVESGLIDKKGELTRSGKIFYEKLMGAVDRLKKGIPFEARVDSSEKKAYQGVRPWNYLTVRKKTVFTNGELLAVGEPSREMGATPLSDPMRSSMARQIKEYVEASKEGIEVNPHTFQMQSLDGIEIVWLASNDQKIFRAVQAKYYDYLQGRFPKGKWLARGGTDPLTVVVKNKGIGDVVGLLMPVLVKDVFPRPELREGWGDAKNEEVPE